MFVKPIITDRVEDIPIEQLQGLMRETFWGATRPTEQVRRLLVDSNIVMGALESGQLIGFARAISDGAAYAWIFDMIVTKSRRQCGVASLLLQSLLSHPRIACVPKIRLDTSDAQLFYAKFGFEIIAIGTAQYPGQVTMELKR